MGAEGRTIDELAFKGREEALTHRVIVAITHRTHGGSDTGLLAASPEGDRGVLGALIGMMDDIAGLALVQSHVQRIQHQLGHTIINYLVWFFGSGTDIAKRDLRLGLIHNQDRRTPGILEI